MLKQLHKSSLLLFACFGLCCSGNLVAQRLVNDKFDYGDTPGSLTTASNGAWIAHDVPGVEPVEYAPGSLLLPGFASDGTGKVLFASASGAAGREDVNFPFAIQKMSEVQTLYGSALVNFSTAGNAGIFFHFMASNTSHYSRVFVQASGEGYNLGITRNLSTTSEVSWSPEVYEFGKTYLVVMKYAHVPGDKNDLVKLWVLESAPETEAAAGEGVTSKDDSNDIANLLAVGIRQTGVTHSGSIDNVMVGNTWADVMPSATPDTTPPAFVSGTPENGATDIATNTSITLEFDELVSAGTGNFLLSWNGGSTTLAAISDDITFSGTSVTLSNLALQAGTTYTVQVEPTAVKDASGNYYAGISGNTWTFTTSTKAAVPGQAFSEDFEYDPETQLMNIPGWGHNGGTITVRPITVTDGGLSYPDLLGSGSGNAIALQATGQGLDKEIGTTFTSGSVYTSMLVNFSETQTDGNYFFYLNPATGATNYFGRIFARKSSDGKFNLGIAKQSTVTYGTEEYNIGETYLLVMKFTFVEGSTNDLAELFVNPAAGSAEPATATVRAGLANGDPAGGLAAFGLRQVQLSSSPTLTLDAIKIGSTWESVTPAAAQADTTPPALVSGMPANEATGIETSLTMVINFDKPVTPGTGNFILTWDGGTTSVSATDEKVSFEGSTVTISGIELQHNTTYSAQIEDNAVRDEAGNFFTGLGAGAWTFTTAQAPLSVKADVAGTFSVWPNPTAGAASVRLPATLSAQDNVVFGLYSLHGELLLQATGTEQALSEQLTRKLGTVATGMYLVRIQAGDRTYQTRIIKK